MSMTKVLSVNDIMANCPEKLLRYVPQLLSGLEARKRARAQGVDSDHMPPLPILAIKGWRFSGKELQWDSLIKTPQGDILIKDCTPGTKIFGINGNIYTCTGHYPQGRKPLYKVLFNDGTYAIAGLNHLWSVYTSKGNLIVKTTQELINNGIARNSNGIKHHKYRIPVCQPVKFSTKELPIHPYLLGVLLGDGCLCSEHIHISNCDTEIYKKIQSLGYELSPQKEYTNPKGKCIQYTLLNRPHSYNKDLKSLGLKVHGCDKFIPDIYLQSSIDQRIELLRGLMDTDGTATNGYASFSTSSKKLRDSICELVQSLGGIAKISPYIDNRHGKENYTIGIKTHQNPFYLSKKADKWKPCNISKYIKDITYHKDDEAYCITTDGPDSLFLTDHYIATHNSQFGVRFEVAAILDGWAQSAMLAAITQDGSKDTMQLLDKVLEEAEEPTQFQRQSDHPIRILSQGEPIYIEYLNKVDSKARQTSADILMIEELEKWNETAGKASLLTMLRHFDCIIALSNDFPRWARKLFESFNATFVEVTYMDNKMLEKSIKDGLERQRVEDPDGWARDVAYLPTGGARRVFSERAIANAFAPKNPKFQRKTSILSIDVGAGGADNSVIMRLDFDGYAIEAEVLTDESIDSVALCRRVSDYRVSQRADEEIWDAQGVGLGIMPQRAPKEQWPSAGIVAFGGGAIDKSSYYNARAEAMMLTANGLMKGSIKVIGLTEIQKTQLEAEFRAHTIKENDSVARTNVHAIQLDKKEIVRARLGGMSPNILDALSMGVWRLLTYTVHNDNILPTNDYASYGAEDMGVPGL